MVKLKYKNNSAHFTVDFECLTHDFCRNLETYDKPKLRTECLYQSLRNIEKLISDSAGHNPRLTFFCTAVTADLYPEILKKISEQGHEIACHGNLHDDVDKMDVDKLYSSLKEAKDKLSCVANQEVIGFRAPRFSISKFDIDRLDVISQVFKYDSSLHFNNKLEFDIWKRKCPVNILEFPVPQQKIIFSKFKVKLGGSYIKLFPIFFVEQAAHSSSENGLTPIFYFHPYDLYYGYGMLASWKELRGARLQLYWYIRQIQWAGIFNWSQQKKLKRLFTSFNNIGPLGDIVDNI